MTINNEELLEALRLESRLRQHAEASMRESELMLTGMRAILEASTGEQLYEQTLALFALLIDSDHALILERQSDGSWMCVASDNDGWLQKVWQHDKVLQRALEGEPAAVVSARRQPIWLPHLNDDVGAVLYGPFSGNDRDDILVFVHHEIGFYVQEHVHLLQRYSQLTHQVRLSLDAKFQAFKSDDLEQAKERAEKSLVHAEKMVSLGTLAAGVAHEINNPVGFINSNMHYFREFSELSCTFAQKVLPLLQSIADSDCAQQSQAQQLLRYMAREEYLERCEELAEVAGECSDGLNRIREITEGLRTFSRQDEDVGEEIDVNQCIHTTLRMVNNELKYHCDVVQQLHHIGPVLGASGQLTQVLTNLMVNAGHAIEGRGTVTISSGREQRDDTWYIYVSVEDTGKGIAAKDLDRIFDPFFTTKEVGKGTGLGLAISHSIIEKMHGHIEVRSTLGKGTRFVVWLPEAQPPADP
ncbi:two-component sensor histidine kinase [Bacterioplanes sanyensis]|uniref:histidine kinase n=1 Tax=Bacterioplanes sanyensis TaxID=1249553 RepID=A0A222FG54_9GAMM|nr:ATP-binding protein [Bacterioplanes sanyensis]ASP37612.1 two-component sensor histidine kinase [Bacterioplanes sanyensis]